MFMCVIVDAHADDVQMHAACNCGCVLCLSSFSCSGVTWICVIVDVRRFVVMDAMCCGLTFVCQGCFVVGV